MPPKIRPDWTTEFKRYAKLVEENDPALSMATYCTQAEGLVLIAIVIPENVPGWRMLQAALRKARAEHGRPRWVVFASEAWEQDPADRIGEPDERMQSLHEAGDPTIFESVVILAAWRGGGWAYRRSFTRTDGTVTWGESNFESLAESVQGNMVNVLHEAVR